MNSVKENIEKLLKKVRESCKIANRSVEEVRIVAVSKGKEQSLIDEAFQAGIKEFGENKVQETERKSFPNEIKLHMVGHLQSNKAAKATELFDYIHSIDSLELAGKVGKKALELEKEIEALLQVNVANEERKYGVKVDEAARVAVEISELQGIKLRGLMTIAPLSDNEENSRMHFKKLKELKEEINEENGLKLQELSMGMTNDFSIAIQEGATIIRVGRAIFG